MIIYNLLTEIGSNIRVIVESSKDQTVLFDDSSDYLLTERKDLSQLSIYSCCLINNLDDDDVIRHIDDKYNVCDVGLRIQVNPINPISFICYKLSVFKNWIKYNLFYENIKRILITKFIRIFFNKWYVPDCDLPFMTNKDISANITKTDRVRVTIYSRDIWLQHNFKYKFPIFRIDVLDYKHPFKYLGFIDSETEYVDTTMIFSLEPNPKWLQDYNKIKQQLQGNIISKDEIQKLVDFVANNYDLFRSAWDVNTRKFGTFSAGYDMSKIKPIE